MVADPLTKGVLPKTFIENTTHMGILHWEELSVKVGVCMWCS